MKYIILILNLFLFCCLSCQENADNPEPVKYTFKVAGSDSLFVYLFTPQGDKEYDKYPSMVIFHGGGWSIGEPSWAFNRAQNYANKGMLVIAAQYRLSDQKSITPVNAMEDACDIIIWMRKHSDDLKINPERIAAYGWSAGAHLAACAAVFPVYTPDSSISSIPDALILHSPAVSVVDDGWFEKLLLNRGKAADYSPAEHIKGEMPPSIIVTGRDDTVTPVEGSILYHENMIKYNNLSLLHIFDDVGHMFTPLDQPDNELPNPDKEVVYRAFQEVDSFLRNLKYIE